MRGEVDAAEFWDQEAARFDEEPDHGLRDEAVRRAWSELLLPLMPPAPASVIDLGCGTGSLSVLLAAHGYDVQALDISPQMIAIARSKAAAAGVDVQFVQGDASDPPYAPGSCDVILGRHVLWALPDPDAAIARWTALLRPAGRLVLVEGRWSTGAGLKAGEARGLVLTHRADAEVRPLRNPALWGRAIDDERYLLISRS